MKIFKPFIRFLLGKKNKTEVVVSGKSLSDIIRAEKDKTTTEKNNQKPNQPEEIDFTGEP